jgi:polysaccharide deacetylase family protein (PEP-CTERM system associated)
MMGCARSIIESLADGNGCMKCILSVDVEDWFHILDLRTAPGIDQWTALPSRVEANFRRLLDLFSGAGVSATCFFLGWIAKRFPHLVREAQERGHEVASHGLEHRLVYEMTADEFLADAKASREILEDITGNAVHGYRGPGFSVTEATPWFFERLAEAGYRYDSSVFPARRAHGGLATPHLSPYRIHTAAGWLTEFPISVTTIFSKRVCFSGGGYLRLFPLSFIRRMTGRVLSEGRPAVFYIHPREIDPLQPRLPMGLGRKFKTYVNLKTTEAKLRQLLADFEMVSFRDFVAQSGMLPDVHVADSAQVESERIGL